MASESWNYPLSLAGKPLNCAGPWLSMTNNEITV